MNYYSDKNGEITDVITALEVAVNEDDAIEMQRILDWTAEKMGLTEGPIDLNGDMMCPLEIDDDYNIWVWRPMTGRKILSSLLTGFSKDAFKEDRDGEKIC